MADRIAGVSDGDGAQSVRGVGGLTWEQEDAVEHWRLHPWNFKTAKWQGRPILWTKDERDDRAPLKPYPSHLKYLQYYNDVLLNEDFILADKARQMYISTDTLLFLMWYCLFKDNRFCIVSKTKEDEAIKLLADKVRVPASHLPDWFKREFPISAKPQKDVIFRKTDSHMLGVAENVADAEARGNTASIVFVDEAGFQAYFGSIVAATQPMVNKFIAVTTPNIGNPGAAEFKSYLDDEEESEENAEYPILYGPDGEGIGEINSTEESE